MRAPRSPAEYDAELARLLADLLVDKWYREAGIVRPTPEPEPDRQPPPRPRRRRARARRVAEVRR
jgi:hypothetical protein